MRCWLGTEVEHNLNFNNLTLFIDSPAVYLFRVIKILEDNKLKNISLYFGANETDVKLFVGTPEEIDFLRKNYTLLIETEKFYSQISYDIFDNIIIRSCSDVDLDVSKISLKYKNKNDSVHVLNIKDFNCTTSLDNLSENGMFENIDKIIYEDN